jgi:hypothetical protein
MILYIKGPKNSTSKLLDTINNFNNVAGYKINLQKSVAFLYTNKEQIEKEYKKTIPFAIVSKKIKYLGVNLTKDINDLFKENYKPLEKEIESDYRRWKDLPCSWIGRMNKVKMAILPKAIYMFNRIPIKMKFITETEKIYPKFHLETQKTANSQGNVEHKEQCLRYHNTRLHTTLQIHSNKSNMVLAKNRHEDQWNRIEDQDMNPHSYAYLIFDKVTKNIQWRKDRLFNEYCWEKWLFACRKLKLGPCIPPFSSINSKLE